jgi:Fe-S-cluster containining protein
MKKYYTRLGLTLYSWNSEYHIRTPHKCKCFNGKTKRCTKYEDRPSICKVFPDIFLPHMTPYCPLMVARYKEGFYN